MKYLKEEGHIQLTITIDLDIKEMFDIALGIKKQSITEVIQPMICMYISETFEKVAKDFREEINHNNRVNSNEIGVRVGHFIDVELVISDYINEIFNMALKINGEDNGVIIEKMMQKYIVNTFGEISDRYNKEVDLDSKNRLDKEDKYFLKALKKVRRWAFNKEQVPFKIIRAFFKLQYKKNNVYYSDLIALCTDSSHKDTYVEQFVGNFNQLKYDTSKSYGKVFVVRKDTSEVEIWDEIKEEILKYKDRFFLHD